MPRDKRAYRRRAAALYALALLRFAMLGFSYRPLLDDYIQYYNYANLMGSLPEVVKTLGLFAARPLAGLADIVVWSHFWPCLFVAVALLAGFYLRGRVWRLAGGAAPSPEAMRNDVLTGMRCYLEGYALHLQPQAGDLKGV